MLTTTPDAVTVPTPLPSAESPSRPAPRSPRPLPVDHPLAGAREFVRRPVAAPRPRALSTVDEHRLALYTALTTAGVAPVEGDRSAVYAIATLDADAVRSVIAWIGAAAAR